MEAKRGEGAMHQVVCHECQKKYDFEEHDFCPRCGAFTPPAKQWDVDARGNVVRVDGINERGHAGSFVHREVHREKAVRKAKGLDRDTARKFTARAKEMVKRVQSIGNPAQNDKNHKTFVGVICDILSAVLDLLDEIF